MQLTFAPSSAYCPSLFIHRASKQWLLLTTHCAYTSQVPLNIHDLSSHAGSSSSLTIGPAAPDGKPVKVQVDDDVLAAGANEFVPMVNNSFDDNTQIKIEDTAVKMEAEDHDHAVNHAAAALYVDNGINDVSFYSTADDESVYDITLDGIDDGSDDGMLA